MPCCAASSRMDRRLRRRRPEPAAIDITWVSCRGVRSSLPFHTPCLYTSIYLTTSSGAKSVHARRPHRVKTPTDRSGGGNPEWDEQLRLYVVPDSAAASQDRDRRVDDSDDVLILRFDLKAEVAVLGDVLAASAVVPVSDLVADGRTRRVSYQLAASDGRQPNGVISFSYAFHGGSNNEDQEDRNSDGKPVTPLLTDAASAVALPSAPRSVSGIYPVMDCSLTEQLAVYPPVTADTITCSSNYCPQPPPVTPVEPVAVYPQVTADTIMCASNYRPRPPPVTPVEPVAVYAPSPETSARCIYPKVEEPVSGMYPTIELAPVTCYPPSVACFGGGFGYAAPEWDVRCLYS